MFEQLFTQPGAIERYQAAPLASDRLKYLIHCAQSGVGRNMLRKIAVSQLHLVHLLSLKEDEEVTCQLQKISSDEPVQPGIHEASCPTGHVA